MFAGTLGSCCSSAALHPDVLDPLRNEFKTPQFHHRKMISFRNEYLVFLRWQERLTRAGPDVEVYRGFNDGLILAASLRRISSRCKQNSASCADPFGYC
jgi:hypothetical protein